MVVDPWINGLWDALKKIFSKMSATDLVDDTSLSTDHRSVCIQENLESSVQSLKLLHINDEDGEKSRTESETESGDVISPSEASLNRSIAPLCLSSLSVPSLPASYLEVCLGEVLVGEVRCFCT